MPFLCEVISSYQNIERDLLHLDNIYQIGQIKNIKSLREFNVDIKLQDTFCVLPWFHFYFNPQGKIYPCCVSDINYPLGSYTDQDVNFNSDEIQNFRKNLLEGQAVPHCKKCYDQETKGLVSIRNISNQEFKKFIPIKLSEHVS